MLPAQLLLQENAAPQDGNHAVGGDDGGSQSGLAAGQCVDVGQLTGSFKAGADVLGNLQLCHQLLLLVDAGVQEAGDTCHQEGQLVGHIGRVLIQGFQHQIIGKGAGGVQHTVGDGQSQCQPALGILVVGLLLTGSPESFILICLYKAQPNDTGTGQYNGQILGSGHDVGGAADDGDDGYQRTGGVADRGGDAQLDVAQTHIAQSHGADVQQGNRQVDPDDTPGDFYAADEDLVGSVQTHDHAHSHDHFKLAVFVEGIPAADLGEEIGTRPAQQGNNGKPEPTHKKYLSLL